MAKRMRTPATPLETQHKSSMDRDRIPADYDVMNQINLCPHGVTAAKIADIINAKVRNVLITLRHLKFQGYVVCQDDEPQACSIWTKVENNPRSVAII